ncbi:MAG: serine hydrolase, partial [Gammaproteobacteria bacterium]|nr:serine hydrolase [Gammaproteobacteria bacterium]
VPGERVVYTSYGYNLLAAILQNAAGKRFQDYIRETIIDPMELKNTGQIDLRFPMENRSRMYSFVDPYSRDVSDRLMVVPTMEHSYNAGGGNLYSTAEDLAVFGAKFITPGFLSERIYQQIYTPHQTSRGEPTWFSDGWVLIALTEDPASLISAGSYPGVQAMLRVYPDEAMVIVLLTNTWGKKGSGGAFANRLSDELATIILSSAE